MSDLFHYHIPRVVKHETPFNKNKKKREREREALIAHENASAWHCNGREIFTG